MLFQGKLFKSVLLCYEEKNMRRRIKNTPSHMEMFLIKYYSLPIIFQTIALNAAPMNGPTMNTHNSLNA